MPENFLYEKKKSLVTQTEMQFLHAIRNVLPRGYYVQPQVNLASIVRRTDHAKYQNELFHNVDFLITDASCEPLVAIEVNDETHKAKGRKYRDVRVKHILEEAGVPLITLWVDKGVHPDYIEKRIREALAAIPVRRVSHPEDRHERRPDAPFDRGKKGCYIATCVYGSYDCPQVCVLRRFRDNYLEQSAFGHAFVRLYYAVSPKLAELFGKNRALRRVGRKILDKWVFHLCQKGIADTPYED